MKLFKRANHLSHYLSLQSKKGISVGFVPTMGALHKGHISLIEVSNEVNDLTVCSIFINPTQFNNADDLAKYPVSIEQDIEQLISADCDVLFLPSRDEIYPSHYTAPTYNLGALEEVLEGQYRPGHFQGVCQVVHRLLSIVSPHDLYLGAKDYQQVKVLQQLLRLLGWDTTRLHKQSTLREPDGLAMSSRNLRLNKEQRGKAPQLFKALSKMKQDFDPANIEALEAAAIAYLKASDFAVDYITIADADTLQLPTHQTESYVALAAVFLGDIRLIDNLELTANN